MKIINKLLAIPTDKYLHFLVSAVLAELGMILFDNIMQTAIIVLAIGIAKEYVIDLWIRKTKADWGDIVADAIGTLCGCLMMIL